MRTALKESKMTLVEVARKSGVPASKIRSYLKGAVAPKVAQVLQLCDAMDAHLEIVPNK